MRLEPLRHTPAGIAVAEFGLQHESQAVEAGATRTVQLEIDAVAFEAEARLVAAMPLGTGLRVEGFLSAKRKGGKKVVLHATRIEFVERT